MKKIIPSLILALFALGACEKEKEFRITPTWRSDEWRYDKPDITGDYLVFETKCLRCETMCDDQTKWICYTDYGIEHYDPHYGWLAGFKWNKKEDGTKSLNEYKKVIAWIPLPYHKEVEPDSTVWEVSGNWTLNDRKTPYYKTRYR